MFLRTEAKATSTYPVQLDYKYRNFKGITAANGKIWRGFEWCRAVFVALSQGVQGL
jgi:hypothetical protein